MKRLQILAVSLLVLMFTMGGLAFAGDSYYTKSVGQININTASRDEMVWILGENRVPNATQIADNIIAYRDANGPFDNVNDLRGVNGINDKVFNQILPSVKLSGPTEFNPEASLPAPGNDRIPGPISRD